MAQKIQPFQGLKPWYKSRAIWSASLQIVASTIAAAAIWLSNGDTNALLVVLGSTFKGLFDLYVRITTDQPIG